MTNNKNKIPSQLTTSVRQYTLSQIFSEKSETYKGKC